MIKKKMFKKILSSLVLATMAVPIIGNINTKKAMADPSVNYGTMGYVAGYSLNGSSTNIYGTQRQMEHYEVNSETGWCMEPRRVRPDGKTEVEPIPLEGSVVYTDNGMKTIDENLGYELGIVKAYGYERNIGNLTETAEEMRNSSGIYNKREQFVQRYAWEKLGYKLEFNISGFEYLEAEYQVWKSLMQDVVRTMTEKPSFQNIDISLKVGETKTLTDTNNVFKYYFGTEKIPSGINVTTSGNDISITGNEPGNYSYTKKQFTDNLITKMPLIYQNGETQKLSTLYVKDPGSMILNVNVVDEKRELTIKKVDKNGKPLANAIVNINNDTLDKNIGDFTTDNKGEFVIKDKEIYLGNKITGTEKQAPAGYVLDKTPKTITIQETNNALTFINDVAVGELRLLKVDETTGATLQGAIFDLYQKDKDGKVLPISNFTTDKQGLGVVSKLALGNYFIKETKAPIGYKLDTTEYPVELTYIDQNTKVVVAELTVKNKVDYSSVEISKLDISDKKPLPNTEIAIFTKEDKEIFRGVTDEKGQLKFNKLTPNDYYFMETKAPVGYVLNKDKHPFTVKEYGEIVKCTLEDERNVEINKTDVDTSKPLPNAEFTLWNDKNEVIAKDKTDENGQIKLALPVGKYRYEETGVPDGYDKSIVKSGIIEVKENGIKYVEKVTNKKLQLESLPETGEAKTPYVVMFGGIFLALAFIITVNTIDKKKKNTKK